LDSRPYGGQRSVRLNAVAVLGAAAALFGGKAPAHVAVVGNDYTFVQFPQTIAAGPTFFSFENRGKVRHEFSVALLQPGVTAQQIAESGRSANARVFLQRSVGLLIARPGETSGGELYIELKSGQRYLVTCTLKDSVDSKPHAQMGMMTSFDVP
jgi:hypothetical protein